jgi:VIT1/CCC1 family predicted Fe2+/Mn2+ transporter
MQKLEIKHPFKVGLSFGLTSGIITTLGLIIGLYSSTHSKLVIIGGILTIAIADAISDGLGIHISEESEAKHTPKEIWQATFSTFFSKFIFALTFAIPFLFFTPKIAVVVSIIWGAILLAFLSFYIARSEKIKPWKVITEHLMIATIVVVITHFIGLWISKNFGS